MWKAFVQDYLSFTRKDRVGVIVLVVLIIIVVVLPYAWPPKKMQALNKQELEQIRLQTAHADQNTNTPETERTAAQVPGIYPSKKPRYRENAVLFYFDPNVLDAAGWKRLGIREKTVATILNYRTRGGKFRKPEDIGKIYGLFKDDYERLLPYVQITPESASRDKKDEYKRPRENDRVAVKPAYTPAHIRPATAIDINVADTTAFIALPGIGSKLALRIVNFRNKLGGFYSVQQVSETYGLPDSTFKAIENLLRCANPAVQQLNINTADANTLKQHPYIRWSLANAVIQYRAQHGNFASVEDIQRVALITADIFEKIKPYLTVRQ